LVGYIASSAASDLLHMLSAGGFLAAVPQVTDAGSFAPLLSHWGDRSVTYLCARDDGVLSTYRRASGESLSDQLAFCYLRVTGEGIPARLEFPRWLAEQPEELARVLDLVRAECIIGLGYPYAIETADQTAVLGGREREAFKALVTEFARSANIELRTTAKARSKQRRRLGARA
jgi:hypothetical protein